MPKTCKRRLAAALVLAAVGAWFGGAAGSADAAATGDTAPAEIDAAHVRADIEDALARLAWPMVIGGEVIVAERDGAFHVVVPGVVVESQDGSALDIGDVEAVARPLPDARYELRVTVPSTLLVRDAAGATSAHVTIGAQRFEGIWIPAFGTFVQLDADYRDIAVAAPDGPATMTLREVTVDVDYAETGPGLWSGVTEARADTLEFGNEGGGRTTIESLAVQSRGEDMKLAEMNRLGEEMNAIMLDIEGSESVDAISLAMLQTIAAMPGMFRGASVELATMGVDVAGPDGLHLLGLDRVNIRFGMRDFDKERSRVDMRYEHGGLDIAATGGVAGELAPRHVLLDVAAVDVPGEALARAVADYAERAADAPPEAAWTALSRTISAALSDAASEVTVNRLTMESPGVRLLAGGALRADPHALYGAVGSFDAEIRGLEKLVASFQATPQDPAAMQAVMMMAMVHALGEAGIDGAGEAIRRYRFELGRNGTVMLNGNDLQQLFALPPRQ